MFTFISVKKLTLIIEKKQINMKTLDHSYHQNFEYKHQNPYHDKLGEYSDFVFRDTEGEKLKGNGQKNFLKMIKRSMLKLAVVTGILCLSIANTTPLKTLLGLIIVLKEALP